MTTKNLLIMTARKISDEMQQIFGEIYPALIPVNDSTRVIDKQIATYSESVDKIYIAINENDNSVQEYIASKNFTVTTIKVKDGLSLGDAVFDSISKINDDSELILSLGDTLIETESLFKTDTLFTYDVPDSKRWTTINENNKQLEFNDKKQVSPTLSSYQAVVGIFNFSSLSDLKQHWNNNTDFYKNIEAYNSIHPLALVKADSWQDFGHSDLYTQAKQEVEARFFNTVKIDFKRGIIRKESTDVDKFLGEVKWYLKLPGGLTYIAPRIFNYSLNYNHPSVEMEYLSYENLHNLFLFGNLELGFWKDIFDEMFFLRSEMESFKVSITSDVFSETVEDIYLNKSLQRLNKLITEDPYYNEIKDQSLVINGTQYSSINEIMKQIPTLLKDNGLLEGNEFSVIHGDYCFPNVLYDNTKKVMRLIDPRGKFGEFDIYGDPIYDYAKMAHSALGLYDIIIADQFKVEADNNKIDLTMNITDKQKEIGSLFSDMLEEHLGEQRYKQARLVESLLFLSMIPLHKDYPDRQKAMLCTGVTEIAPFLMNTNNN